MTNTPSSQPLSDKRIVITGAGRGLGRALAIIAADFGAEVVLLGRDLNALQAVADTIQSRSLNTPLTVPCDLSQADSIAAACDIVLARNPVVDVLINNGAPWLTGKLDELSDNDITATISASVSGTILVTRGLLPGLHLSTAADVVTVVSTSGITGWNANGASAPFHAAKHGQSGFSDYLRHELKEHNIRVSALYPPDFEDLDPLDSGWNDYNNFSGEGNITNREVVSSILFVINAPRNCSFPVIILDNM